MALSRRSCAQLLVVLTLCCLQVYQAHDFIGRCVCHSSIKFIKGKMSDFQVLEKRPGCDHTELIVTMKKPDNSTADFCVNLDGKMGKAFLKCWERINKDEGRKMECIDRKRKAE